MLSKSNKFKIYFLGALTYFAFCVCAIAYDDVFFGDDEFVLTALVGDCGLINSQWYCAGESVLGAKILSVSKDNVLLDDGSKQFFVYLKKSALNR